MTTFQLDPHHAANRRWPAFEQLMDLADEKRWQVGLKVTDVLLDKGTPSQRRAWERLAVRKTQSTSVSHKIKAGDLDATAAEFL